MNQDPYQAKQYWVEIVRSASDQGKLEKIPCRHAKSRADERTAREQSIAISRRSYGIAPDAYDRIFGGK